MTPSLTPNLYALMIRLTATHNGRLHSTQGHLAHAAFLNIVQQVDPALSAALHDKNGRKPFTVSPLQGFGHGHKGRVDIHAGQSGWLRVTLLDPTLFQTFIRYFLEGRRPPTLRLEQMQFAISEILSTNGSHPLAGSSSLAALEAKWAAMSQPPTTIPLTFRTPTAFSLRNGRFRHMHILPDPSLVFGELAGYWDQLTASQTKEAVRQFTAFGVVVARHNIASHMYQYSKSKQVGFCGDVEFKILDDTNPTMTNYLNLLADLAFYTGVGSKTTQGMGQVVRIMKDEL
ncbi:MAG: CRISPR-associated endoribonuclease Cas6 [Anaerolineales bacterium]|nr:CRISPR-associated endoribonuclease Cas6 [Anaerolineales bacterium]